ncbi:protein of unknown function [Maridesulfovibrio hydrothermalis AM13 = DSM 14728]|uniref:Uncharacterized protein n=1 Tax=Maridesulfovibrio hydrothermalis AM13 = DSM 14728 TaxID=1121451 RepID=L0RFH4_9BACT|nr:protein of unknown function [Maridesulfovibrio hydrothermalis AM13 = DSM 14728]
MIVKFQKWNSLLSAANVLTLKGCYEIFNPKQDCTNVSLYSISHCYIDFSHS